MATDAQKASAFVGRLLQNPSLTGLTPLQKEEQILQFLAKNSSQLYPTLHSPAFFPDKNWEQIWSLLIQTLYTEINKALLPELQQILTDKIDFSFITFFRQQNMSFPQLQEALYKFLEELLKRPEVRRGCTGAFSALAYNFSDKYVDQVFARKEYIHFELTKVQRLKLPREETKQMIQASILLKPIIYFLSSSSGNQPMDTANTVQMQFAEKVLQVIKKRLVFLPDELLRSALNSNVSFMENRNLRATARITALFSARCRNYNPNLKIDRGADTADKSWFNIARRNFKFYGYDIKMLDEFYKIAAENGW